MISEAVASFKSSKLLQLNRNSLAVDTEEIYSGASHLPKQDSDGGERILTSDMLYMSSQYWITQDCPQ